MVPAGRSPLWRHEASDGRHMDTFGTMPMIADGAGVRTQTPPVAVSLDIATREANAALIRILRLAAVLRLLERSA